MIEPLVIIEGDLLNSSEAVIAHGCNTQGVMGAGIAGQIKNKWKRVYEQNRDACNMGQFVPGSAHLVNTHYDPQPGGKWVFNLATQDQPGPNARYEWVYLAFRNMAEHCAVHGIRRVAIPQIGCGIGGLVWDEVEWEIEQALQETRNRGHELDVVCYVYTPAPVYQLSATKKAT